MKTSNLLKSIVVITALSLIGCNKDQEENNDSGRLTTEDISANAKMDAISNDISEIAEDRLNTQSSARTANFQSILPDCASVTTTVSGNTWTSVINFGTTGCQYYNGAMLRGEIIVSGSTNFDQSPYVWTYNFNNFYYNDILVEGTKTLSRTVQATAALATPHPVVVIDLDLDITLPNGNEYSRVGTRTRELIEGYDTPLLFLDNVYQITGNWTTTGANSSHISTITTPLRVEIDCLHKLVSGVITITRNNHIAVLDYGNGNCDNTATIAMDGGAPYTFTFGN
ncbi:hypothetical protein FLJC2902T_08200 [Flavobacterium limnosediminis JC2902]|uniref:Lipoprotein n=1 Tax=Flavobacterium limnosediminis JC2902 TaxID=1341181 RepID=V6SRT6_9FLAO|nr:hypothetical protein [Flavobacterium limnosediminis]ESU29418.1 hypothetical protein FLJC2902T_08200 [Flavobacterium limnosediminis JC2902]